VSKSIYVGNVEWNTTDQELEDLFVTYGTIRSAQIIKDHTSGKSKGFGFVEMEDEEAAETAMKELHGTELRGRTLKINAARERKSRTF
jgi:RNA recognition motif-containing protein